MIHGAQLHDYRDTVSCSKQEQDEFVVLCGMRIIRRSVRLDAAVNDMFAPGLQRVEQVQRETEAARQRAEQSKLAKAETEAQKRARLKATFLKKQLQAGKAHKQ